MAKLFLLVRSKSKRNCSAKLERALLDRGVDVYRVTAAHVPLQRVEDAEVVLSYGTSAEPIWRHRLRPGVTWLNTTDTVRISANKRTSFRVLREAGVPCVEATESRAVAQGWLDAGRTVVTRTRLQSHSGRGIVLSPPDPLPQDARLYTKLFKGHNVREYRVYIYNQQALDLTEKRRISREERARRGIDHTDPYQNYVRSWWNGWVFCRNTMDASPEAQAQIKRVAEQCARAIGLGFGAVDLIASYTDGGNLRRVLVVEPNTAPGLDVDSSTLSMYVEAIAAQVGVG